MCKKIKRNQQLFYFKNIFINLFLFLLCADYGLSSAHSEASTQPETVTIGVALRFQTELNSSVDSIYQGIEFATFKFNSSQKKYHIQLKKFPYQAKSVSIENAANQIVQQGVPFVIGGEMSDEAFALAERFKTTSILLFTPTASNPRLTQNYKNVFRMNFSDLDVATGLSKYFQESYCKNKQSLIFGVMRQTDNLYSDYLSTEFQKELSKSCPHSRWVKFDFAGNHGDMQKAVQQFKASNVNWVIDFNSLNHLSSFFKIAIKPENNFRPQYLGSDGWNSNEMLFQNMITQQNEKSFSGIRAAYWYSESKDPATRAFVEDFSLKMGRKPDSSAAIGYDTAWTLYQALGSSRSIKSVSSYLESNIIKSLVTSSNTRFNNEHGLQRSFIIYKIDKDGIHFINKH